MITWWCAFHHNYVGNSARYDQSYYCSVKVYCVPASERALLATTKFLVIVIAVDQYKNWGQFNKASIISASLVMSLMKRSVICAPLFTWPSELHINARNREITFCGFKPEVGCDYRRKSGVGPHGLCLWPPFTGVCAPWPHPRTVSAHSDVNQRVTYQGPLILTTQVWKLSLIVNIWVVKFVLTCWIMYLFIFNL